MISPADLNSLARNLLSYRLKLFNKIMLQPLCCLSCDLFIPTHLISMENRVRRQIKVLKVNFKAK